MLLPLDSILEEIKQERCHPVTLPGSEYDLTYSANDWISVVIHYLTRDVNRKGIVVSNDDYHANLIKAAAVIVAALEHEHQLDKKNKQVKK